MDLKFFSKKGEETFKEGSMKVCETMQDYNNEDFFLKKVETAKEILRKWKVPGELLTGK